MMNVWIVSRSTTHNGTEQIGVFQGEGDALRCAVAQALEGFQGFDATDPYKIICADKSILTTVRSEVRGSIDASLKKYQDLAEPTEEDVQTIFQILDFFMQREASYGSYQIKTNLSEVVAANAEIPNPWWGAIETKHRCPHGKITATLSEVLKRFHAKNLRIKLKDPEYYVQEYTPETWAALDDKYNYQILICWD